MTRSSPDLDPPTRSATAVLLEELALFGARPHDDEPDYRSLPDPETCRTRPIAKIEQFGMCLVRCPVTCPYVSVSETGYICKFCTHPNWKDFVQP